MTSFSDRRKQWQEEQGNKAPDTPPPVAQPAFRPDHVPDVSRDQSDDDNEIDKILNKVGIIQAYNKWCGKMRPDASSRNTEGIMISCPNPSHRDRDPSAWINTEKNTYYCGGCAEGGDIYDIAAFHFGYPRPAYKEGALFHKLRRDMAESLGYIFKQVAGGQHVIIPPTEPDLSSTSETNGDKEPLDTAGKVEPASTSTPNLPPGLSVVPTAPPEEDKADTSATVTPISPDADEVEDIVVYPEINWRKVLPDDTFLRRYMEACSNDDSPEEYHFWHGLVALGHAVGRNVILDDHRPVYGNLLLCLLGGTGSGKSRSRGWLDTVIRAALPYRETGLDTSGVKLIPVPSSGEYLVKQFSYERKDPTNSKAVIGYSPVNGVVDFDELAALLARANRQGSTLKSTIMSFADARDMVSIGGLTHGGFYAEAPFCSITATTQPRAIRTLLTRTDTGSGFLNRWVFAGGPSKEREILGGSHSTTTVDLAPAIELLKQIRGWAGRTRKLTMEPDAMERMTTFYRTQVFPIQEADESDLLKRLDLLFKKLMLLFTINLKRDTVPLEVVDMCIGIWDYIIGCYGILNTNIGITHGQEVAQEILRVIRSFQKKYKKGPTARDISRYTARKNYSPEQIKKALDIMAALDWVDVAKSSGVGRPSIRYLAVGE